MQTAQLVQLGNHRALKQHEESRIFFPVESVRLQDILDPGKKLVAPDQQAIIRTDTGHILHLPKSRYHLTPNSEIFPMVDEAIKQSPIDLGGLKIKDELAYNGGLTVRTYTFPAVKAEPVVGDITELRMKIVNSYNGGSQLRGHIGGYRLACSNGMVLCSGQLDLVSARHTKGLQVKLPDIVQKMIKALEVFMAQTETWKLMTGREITDAQAVHVIKAMPGMNERLEHRLTSLWLDHKAELGPTQWALFNTLTYWSTHDDIRQSSVQNSSAVVLERESKVQCVLEGALWQELAA